jgi:phosphoglycerol transferase MdoB-like AlkP superfamily enzyme
MKKVFLTLLSVSLLAIPMVAFGDVFQGAEPADELPTLLNTGDDVISLINTIGNWIFTILLALAAIFLIWAGFLYVTAAGSEDTLRKSRGMLVNALIGVAIALGAKGLVAVIGNILGYNS